MLSRSPAMRRDSMRWIGLALLFAAAAHAAPKPVPPAQLSAAKADSVRATYARDRADTDENLREGATSYLAAIARADFGGKPSLMLGRTADCDLRVDDPELATHHLRVTVVGDSFLVEAVTDTAHFLVRGQPTRFARLGPGF